MASYPAAPAPAVTLPTLVPAAEASPSGLEATTAATDLMASTPTSFPFEREAMGVADTEPVDDPWHRSTSPEALAAYRALGIDWEATWDEVVEVFRDHAALWHPDRLAGTDPLVQAEGQRRMSEMNRAYAELRRMLRPSRRELFNS